MMKNVTRLLSCLCLALLVFNNPIKAQDAVSVTFKVNTSALSDTLNENHLLQIRGAAIGSDVAGTGLASQVTWDAATGLLPENSGGDYWSITFDMSPGDTLTYKYWAGVNDTTALINGGEQGWESGDNRQFILPEAFSGSDTTSVQWYQSRTSPFETKADSIGIKFRVNVGYQVQTGDFDPEAHSVSVRGTPIPLAWDATTVELEQEPNSTGNNLFYSGVAYFAKSDIEASAPDGYPEGTVKFKYFLNNDSGDGGYESTPDRYVTLGEIADTTFHYEFFSGTKPTSEDLIDASLNFEVNVGILEGLGYFNSAIDTVFVTGTFNGWNNSLDQMNFNSFSGNYEGSVPFKTAVGTEVLYKYFIKWDARRDEASSEFYLPQITHNGSGWEEPGVTGGDNRAFNIVEGAEQPTRSEFYNGVEPKALITSDKVEGGSVTVTFSYNMAPAMDYAADPFDPEVDSVYLFVDTPFFALTNDIVVPGDAGENFVTQTVEAIERMRFTDEDGDDVYTLDLELMLPTLNHIGFRIAYGSALDPSGSLLANGGGTAAGRRHYQYVQPIIDSEGNVTWPSTFTMPTLDWERENLSWETPPDYSKSSTSNEDDLGSPDQFALSQNYPNPFNPTTTINFTLGTAADVNLSVYNLLGQRVATLFTNHKMSSGAHSVSFNASNLSSGVYFYRIEAGDFIQQKSMTLIK